MTTSWMARTAVIAAVLGGSALAADTIRVSVGTGGTEGTGGESLESAVSKNGRHVVFVSGATNLVAGDANNQRDIFVRDVRKDSTTLASVSTDGVQSDDNTYRPSISDNGRYVVFDSDSGTLQIGDNSLRRDVFLHDVKTGTTTRISEPEAGGDANDESYRARIAAGGRHVVFESIATNLMPGIAPTHWNVFVRDVKKNRLVHASPASGGLPDADCYRPDVSKRGRHVVYDSEATNIVPGDGNGARDVFWHDVKTGETRRVSVSSTGGDADGASQIARITGNGRYVVFESDASNLVSGDTNAKKDVFVRDMKSGTTTRVSVASDGSEGTNDSFTASISSNGRRVAFASWAPNFEAEPVNGVTDVFVHDRRKHTTVMVSVDSDETAANAQSNVPAISSSGKFVTFWSYATNLDTSDTNNERDVFLRSLKGK